jgi:hypothetical protein
VHHLDMLLDAASTSFSWIHLSYLVSQAKS